MRDKYEIMTELFLSDPKMKAWHPQMVYQTLKEMDKKGQLFVYPPKSKTGKLKAFVGYVFAGDEYETRILEKKESKFLNLGKNVIPMFWWSSLGFGLNKKICKKLIQIAKDRGGQLWSCRHNRIFKFGRA